eukprot:SAG25_NODE_550_length_6992_cov_63.479182_2_plen_100_part_00
MSHVDWEFLRNAPVLVTRVRSERATVRGQASIVSVPSDVLKKRVVLGLESSVGSAIRHIWAADGARGLFVGWRANVIKDVPFAAVKMSLCAAPPIGGTR